MTDIYERASKTEALLREVDLTNHRQRANLGSPTRWNELSAKHCKADECGLPIPEARRKAVPGVQFCIDCQQLKERRKHL